MAGRIVLLGATGYTGTLTAQALARRGAKPVLAGRDPTRLAPLAERLGALDTAQVDVSELAAVRLLVEPDDVLVTTVGPFVQLGEPAIRAAAEAGARYLDSTGEPAFIRRVFEEFGPLAGGTGGALLTAFGYDYLPGNLAGALALRAAGPAGTSVDIGYFLTGPTRRGFSAGTARSVAEQLGVIGFGFSGGRLRDEVSGPSLGTFNIAGRTRDGISIGASEHFTLPRLHPELTDVNVYLGWFGKRTRAVHRVARLTAPAFRLRPVAAAARAAATALTNTVASRMPQPQRSSDLRTTVVARAKDAGGAILAEVLLDGPEPYQLTADLLAWGATTAAAGGVHGTGALGPVDAFGLDELAAACAELGLRRHDQDPPGTPR